MELLVEDTGGAPVKAGVVPSSPQAERRVQTDAVMAKVHFGLGFNMM
ncbi:hypothetical protein [Amycolatopsis sp. lyj-108]